MKKINWMIIISALTTLVCSSVAIAEETMEKQKQALDVIADFADRICNSIPIEGGSENLELSGAGKIELNKFLKVIADLGVEGGAKYQKTEYNNVLQKDLAGLLIEGSKCKLEVFKELEDKLLLSTLNSPNNASSVTQTSTGDKSPNVSNVRGNVTIQSSDSEEK